MTDGLVLNVATPGRQSTRREQHLRRGQDKLAVMTRAQSEEWAARGIPSMQWRRHQAWGPTSEPFGETDSGRGAPSRLGFAAGPLSGHVLEAALA